MVTTRGDRILCINKWSEVRFRVDADNQFIAQLQDVQNVQRGALDVRLPESFEAFVEGVHLLLDDFIWSNLLQVPAFFQKGVKTSGGWRHEGMPSRLWSRCCSSLGQFRNAFAVGPSTSQSVGALVTCVAAMTSDPLEANLTLLHFLVNEFP